MDGHDGGGAQQAAEFHRIPHHLAGGGDEADGGGLGVDHADGGLVGDDGGEGGGGGVAGDGDHVQANGAHTGHGLQLIQVEGARAGGGDHALVLADGDEGAGQAAHVGGGHDAPFLHCVVEQGQGGGGAVGTAGLQAHLLQNAGHAVADGGGGGQGEIHDAKGHAQPAAGLLGHQLAHSGHPEGGLLDGLGHHVEGLALHVLEGVVHHAGAGHAHIDDAVRLPHAVEGARHEGVILHRIAEYHQLGAAKAAPVGGALGGVLDDAAHLGHRVHVDPRPGGANVDGGADKVGDGQRLGDRGDELLVGLGGPLLHQGGEAADEVDPGGLGGVVHGHGEGDVAARLRRPGHKSHGGDGDAFVDDGDAELPLNGLAGGHQVLGPAGDLVIDLLTGGLWIGIGAVQQGDAHGNGTHVQMLLVDHMYGIQNFVGVDQVNSS